jgi:hypothetical protein
MEQDEGFPVARGANIEAVHKTLIDAGIVFIPENGGGVGVRLRKPVAAPAEPASASRPVADTKTVPPRKTRSRRP